MDAASRAPTPQHPLLNRQLRRLGLSRDRAPSLEEWQQFLEKMGAAYDDADRDRDLLERSLAISSVEMRALYDDLKRSTDNELLARSNELQASTAIANAILDATYTGILLVSTDNRVLKYNRAFLQMCPVPIEILATGEAERVFACAHSKLLDPDAFLVQVQSIAERDQPTPPFEIRFTSGRTYEVETYPVLAHDGARVGRLWAFSDSTARARERREMLELNSFLDSIVENIPDMIFVKEVPSMRFVRINRAGEQLLGYREIELLGRADHELFPQEQADGFAARDQQALSEAPRPLQVIEETIKTRHLGERVLATRKIAILDAQKNPSFVLGISRDITEQKQAAEEIRKAKETAEQASRAKSDFLANMSHELRTPLNAILGFARVLQSSSKHLLPPREQQWVKLVTISGEHMLQLINDLLDLREAEVKPLKLTAIAIKDAVDESVAVVHWLYEENDLTLLIETPPDTPPVEGEYRALVQALINLLSNAAKFTPRGGRVELRVSHDDNHVFIAVIDTGIGIAAEHLPLLFTFYQRFGGKQRHQMKGSGVGLALTRQLIEAQGGSISVTSEEHHGTEFRLQLRRMASPR